MSFGPLGYITISVCMNNPLVCSSIQIELRFHSTTHEIEWQIALIKPELLSHTCTQYNSQSDYSFNCQKELGEHQKAIDMKFTFL